MAEKFILDDSIGFLINKTAVRLKNELTRSFLKKGHDITADQWGVLVCAWEKEGQTQSEIAEQLDKDKTNLTRIIDIMEKKDLIVRNSSESDRRSYIITLTKKGKGLVPQLIPIAAEIINRCTEGLSNNEKKSTTIILNKIFNKLGENNF